MLLGRPCGPRPGTKNKAWKKDDLVNMAVIHGLIKSGEGKIISVEKLCAMLKTIEDKLDKAPVQEVPKEISNVIIEKYTDKAIVVRGETKTYKEKFTDLGGKWNPNLEGGAGWIFPKTSLDKVQKLVNEINGMINIEVNIDTKTIIKENDIWYGLSLATIIKSFASIIIERTDVETFCDMIKEEKFPQPNKPPIYDQRKTSTEYKDSIIIELTPMNKKSLTEYVENDSDLNINPKDFKNTESLIKEIANDKYEYIMSAKFDKFFFERYDYLPQEVLDEYAPEEKKEEEEEDEIEEILKKEDEEKSKEDPIITITKSGNLDDLMRFKEPLNLDREKLEFMTIDERVEYITNILEELDEFEEDALEDEAAFLDTVKDDPDFEENMKESILDEEDELEDELEDDIGDVTDAVSKLKITGGNVTLGDIRTNVEKEIGMSKISTKFKFKTKEEEKELVFDDSIFKGKLTLKDYQVTAVRFLLRNKGLLLWHSTGSGKTITAAACIQGILNLDPDRKVTVITKAGLVNGFEADLIKYGVDSEKIKKNILILSYEKFSKVYDTEFCTDKFIVIDEVHNLKTTITSTTGKRSGNAMKCTIEAYKVLVLSAGPIYNDITDILNPIAFIKQQAPISKKELESMMDNPRLFEDYFKCCISYYNRERKLTTLDPSEKYIVSAIKEVSNNDYPEVIRYEVMIPMTDEYYKEYHNIENNLVRAGSVGTLVVKESLGRFYTGVRQASNNITDVDSPKIDWIMEKILDCVKKNKRILIYSFFLDKGIQIIMEYLNDLKIRYSEISGKVKDKYSEVENYNKGTVNIMIISKAGGEGINLLGTSTVIIMEPGWNEAGKDQVESRAIRYKSHENYPRLVEVYEVFLTKPKGNTDKNVSVDMYLRKMGAEKTEKANTLLKKILPLTIENMKC